MVHDVYKSVTCFIECDPSDISVRFEGENVDNGVENLRAKEKMDGNPDKRVEKKEHSRSANGKGNYCVTGESCTAAFL